MANCFNFIYFLLLLLLFIQSTSGTHSRYSAFAHTTHTHTHTRTQTQNERTKRNFTIFYNTIYLYTYIIYTIHAYIMYIMYDNFFKFFFFLSYDIIFTNYAASVGRFCPPLNYIRQGRSTLIVLYGVRSVARAHGRRIAWRRLTPARARRSGVPRQLTALSLSHAAATPSPGQQIKR